jgi:hypothetical protein
MGATLFGFSFVGMGLPKAFVAEVANQEKQKADGAAPRHDERRDDQNGDE